jgi:hypothetical protein
MCNEVQPLHGWEHDHGANDWIASIASRNGVNMGLYVSGSKEDAVGDASTKLLNLSDYSLYQI